VAGVGRVEREEHQRLVAGIDRAVRPAGRDIDADPAFEREGAGLAIPGLHQEDSPAAQAQVDLGAAPVGVVMPLGHVVLAVDGAGMQDRHVLDDLPVLRGHVPLEVLVDQRILVRRRSVEVAGHVAQAAEGVALVAGHQPGAEIDPRRERFRIRHGTP
jgi:hypothetical protein